jgi:hypothetical protein
MEIVHRRLMWHGMFLFLLGLVTGLVEQRFANVRMGLSAHLEGVMNGILLLALGCHLERGETAAACKVDGILDRALRYLCELAGHHACCDFRYCGPGSNRSSRP